ncbi:MAG: SCE4755 family polysaccharide monooxygenase-like protein, partial [Nannocystaceae bacterium]
MRTPRSTTRAVSAAIGLGLGLVASPAAAHISMTSPPARYAQDYQKSEPCGHPMNPPGQGEPTVYQAGETITVVFDEFVDHQGHFRIAVDPTGTDAFTSPTAFDDFYNSPEVLLDEIADDQDGGIHMVEVTLPDEPCDPCTLQLIQVMVDGAWGPGNSDLYFQCADIVIEGASAESDGTKGGGDSTGGGGATTGSGASEGGETGGAETATPTSTGGEGSGGEGSGTDGGTDTGDPVEDSDDGCACRSVGTSAPAGMWMLVLLAAARRR